MKQCSKCNQHKTLDHYSKKGFDRKGNRKLQPYCRSCNKEYQKKHYQNNKQIYKDKAHKYDEKTRDKARQYLYRILEKSQCVDCGEKNPIVLQFDHLKDKKHNISSMILAGRYSIKSIKEEMEKCEVVCANCHSIRTAKTFKWHRYTHFKLSSSSG